MKLVIVDHKGLGNVISSLPLLERALEVFGPDNVAVVCRPASLPLLEPLRVKVVHPVRANHELPLRVLELRRRGFRRLVAVPPISALKTRLLCAVTRMEAVEPRESPVLWAGGSIGRAFQQLADALGLGALAAPRLPRDWPGTPLPPDLTRDWKIWKAARPRLAIHLGSDPGNVHKRWSVLRFAACAEMLTSGIPESCVALVGTEGDLASAFRTICSPRVPLLDLTGRTTLEETARFVREASAMLSGDSGLMHLAAALGVPAFAVFGPTSPEFWFPPGNHGRAFQDLACGGPCYPRATRRCRQARCVDRVTAHVVADALMDLLCPIEAAAGLEVHR